MKLQLEIEVTTTEFFAYIIEQGLQRWKLTEKDDRFECIVTHLPKYYDESYFSKTITNDDGTYTLVLMKEDILNVDVTRRFFHKRHKTI